MRTVAHSFVAAAVIISALLGPAVESRAGEIYRSVDAEGHVVYTDQRDPDLAQTQVQIGDTNLYSESEANATQAPPPLPDQEQPPSPGEGYLWTPGYWVWTDDGYYWVPGGWALPPQDDVVWTPGYWSYGDSYYIFHRGYWARNVGFYGGINYGFGFSGVGFTAARSRPGHDAASYNGGPGGTTAIPTVQERMLTTQTHLPATASQRHALEQAARVQRVVHKSVIRGTRSVPTGAPITAASMPRMVPNGVRHEPAPVLSNVVVPAPAIVAHAQAPPARSATASRLSLPVRN